MNLSIELFSNEVLELIFYYVSSGGILAYVNKQWRSIIFNLNDYTIPPIKIDSITKSLSLIEWAHKNGLCKEAFGRA
jgi:hypothetical protein